jgi:protein SCO1/2
LSDLHKKFANEDRVGFLSISSNPEKDQPDVLKAYADRFGADRRWLFLTGPKAAIFSVANEGFKLSLTENAPGSEPVTHSTRLMLVDASGWVRGSYEGVGEDGNAAGARLITDIQTLLNETK